MHRVIAASQDIAVAVGFVDADTDIYNACAIGYQGVVAGIYHKIHLPTYGVFDEDRYFKRGSSCPVYVINGVKVGINICEDIWYPVGPIAVQRDAGAEVIVNINASPYHAGKAASREKMVGTRATDHGLFVAYLNTVGGQDDLVFDGGSMIFDQTGSLVARGEQFREEMVVADLDVEAVFRSRLHDPRPRKENPAILAEIGASQLIEVSETADGRRGGNENGQDLQD